MADVKKDGETVETVATVEPPADNAVVSPAPDAIVRVTFSEHWALYGKGETAGFPADKAAWLISKKVAVAAA